MEEIQSHTSNATRPPKTMMIGVLKNDLLRINHIHQNMTKEACLNFEKYRQILDLLLISVEASILSDLPQFKINK